MTKIVWTLNREGISDFTNKVISINIKQGREKYLDTYSGGFANVTINNTNNFASNFQYGDYVTVKSGTGYDMTFWVQQITYNDAPGNSGFPTATINMADWISRSGRYSFQNKSLTQSSTGQQIYDLFLSSTMIPSMGFNFTGGGSTASAITYSGTFNNYFNLIMQTERGLAFQNTNELTFKARSAVADTTPIFTFGRTLATDQIGYQSFSRIQNGLQFINTASISSQGIATQTAKNTASISANGEAFFSATTVDFSNTQALGNAEWIANNFSDPNSLRFTCSFSDVAQNQTTIDNWLLFTFFYENYTANFSYQIPGGSLTTVPSIIEGYEINATPSQTTFNLNFSPLQYYQFFVLNSNVYGILDTSRLGW